MHCGIVSSGLNNRKKGRDKSVPNQAMETDEEELVAEVTPFPWTLGSRNEPDEDESGDDDEEEDEDEEAEDDGDDLEDEDEFGDDGFDHYEQDDDEEFEDDDQDGW